MKKKLVCMVLVLILALCLFALPVSAETEVLSGSCGENMTWTLEDGVLTISGTGEMDNYNPLGSFGGYVAPWHNLNFTKVVVEAGVTDLGNYAFYDMDCFTTVILPDGLKEIPGHVFEQCRGLEEITLPSDLEVIGYQAFFRCSNLKSVDMPDSVVEIGSMAFDSCMSLESVTLPANLKKLDFGTFRGTGLKSVTLPEGLTTLDTEVFRNCEKLKEVTLPNTLTSMGHGCFDGCEALKSVEIPASLTHIPDSAFYDCPIETLILHEGLTTIGSNAFSSCDMTEIQFPSTLTTIGGSAFSYCSGLTEIVIPDSVTSVNTMAFSNCKNLVDVTFPNNPDTTYGEGIFYGCTALTSIELPENMTVIPRLLFADTNLVEVTIPEGVNIIGSDAFRGTDITEVRLPESLVEIGSGAFGYCKSLTVVHLPNRPDVVYGWGVFEGCTALTQVTIPDAMTTIPAGIFAYTGLTEITIPETVTRIQNNAFENTKLTEVIIPDSVIWIGDRAFSACGSLTQVKLPDNPDAEYGKYVFSGCNGLTEFVIPAYMTSIPEYFLSGTGITEITIPETVVEIREGAFSGSSLEKLIIPSSVEVIGYRAFDKCKGLTEVTLPYTVCSMGLYVFSNCPDLTLAVYENTAGHRYAENEKISYTLLPGPGPEAYHAIMLDVSKNGSVSLSAKHAHQGQIITITAQPDEGCSLVSLVLYYDALEEKNLYIQQISDTTFTFVMPDCTVLAEIVFLDPELPYVDVDPKAYYYVPVLWAHTFEITSGVDATHFGPNNACNRAQVVTFLWRAAGCPEPTTTENPFVDVQEGSYYYKAVLWAVENGITAGVDATHFGPNRGCTRAQVATFLWRACGQPEPLTQENPFRDTNPNSYYYKAVLWAVENGITAGTGNNRFSPDNICTRAQIVSFLYRTFYG